MIKGHNKNLYNTRPNQVNNIPLAYQKFKYFEGSQLDFIFEPQDETHFLENEI